MRFLPSCIRATSLLLMLLVLSFISLQAQQITPQRSHAINNHTGNSAPLTVNQPGDSLAILGVMVEFQPDTNRFTTGNGTFDPGNLSYLDTSTVHIDPLPHNHKYFRSHLEFAQNYFKKVSDNKLNISYRVLPEIYRLDKKMAAYSPTGQNFTNRKLAELIRDVWRKVEERGGFDTRGLDPQTTGFIIFHAGVGRDLELTGTSLTITPQDIPSLYLDRKNLRNLLDRPGFQGFPINNGGFHVSNSMIIPRTLSRPGVSFGNEFVLQLSINGLLTASIGSHLGLPDLFNTRTGNSGIGRFGLMDGASFFSYSGLFPPEPSAWEKVYLGWQQTFPIKPEKKETINVRAVSADQDGPIGKYEISADEYFLVENRHRDPEHDGATLTIRTPEGVDTTQHFSNSNEVFTYQEQGFDTLFIPGVVTDVDNMDFSLPGGFDPGLDGEEGTSDDRFLNGGILIWHIDEAVIQNNLATQSVNNFPGRRGVDLEEADGPQDIGQSIEGTFGGADPRGSPFDFWWKSNNSSVITSNDTISLYQNRFGPDTRPDNRSNSGAPTFFELYDFSGNKVNATFKARRVQPDYIQKLDLPSQQLSDAEVLAPDDNSYFSGYPWDITPFTHDGDTLLVIPSREALYSYELSADNNHRIRKFPVHHPQQPFTGSGKLLVAEAPRPDNDNTSFRPGITAWEWENRTWQKSWQNEIASHRGFLSSIEGDTLHADFSTARLLLEDGSALPASGTSYQESDHADSRYARISNGTLEAFEDGDTFTMDLNSNIPNSRLYTGLLNLSRDRSGFYLLTRQRLLMIEPSAESPVTEITGSTPLGWPAMTDFNGDGRTDFLYVDKQRNLLLAKNINGATLDYFPIDPPDGTRFVGTPIVADLEGDNSPDVLITGQDSLSMNIYGYNSKGDLKAPFPLYVGSIKSRTAEPAHPLLFQETLYAVSQTGDLKAWRFPEIQSVLWRSRYNTPRYNKVSGTAQFNSSPGQITSILNKRETYNWPNPSDERTHIRYQLKKPGAVRVKIIRMDGKTIYDRTFQSNGGSPEEQRISTASWGSGVYYGMIKASVNGKTESKLIKIAVVH